MALSQSQSLQLDDATSTTLLRKLEQLYELWATLRPESTTDKEYDEFGAYFSEDCTAWLSSMKDWANPTRGRREVINEVRAKTKLYYFEQRDILSRFQSVEHGSRKVSIEGKARMNIVMGSTSTATGKKTLDNMFETVVATFDQDSLISELKIYTCRSQLVLVIQGITEAGPYSKEYHAREWQQFLAEEEIQLQVKAKEAGEGNSGSCCP